MEFTEDELSDGAQMVVEVLGVLNPRQPEPNPWSVDSVSQFLHYCCPECPAKTRDLKAFVKHAKSYHEKGSKMFCDNVVSLCDQANVADIYQQPFKKEPMSRVKPDRMIVQVPKSFVEFDNNQDDSDGDNPNPNVNDNDNEVVTARISYKNFLDLMTEEVEETDNQKVQHMTDKWRRHHVPSRLPPKGERQTFMRTLAIPSRPGPVGKMVETLSDISDNEMRYAAEKPITNALKTLKPVPKRILDLDIDDDDDFNWSDNNEDMPVPKFPDDGDVPKFPDAKDTQRAELLERYAREQAEVEAIYSASETPQERITQEVTPAPAFASTSAPSSKSEGISFDCPFCTKVFSSRNAIEVMPHFLIAHPFSSYPVGMMYNCPVEECDFTHTSDEKLQDHLNELHDGIALKPYQCIREECDLSFKRVDERTTHLRVFHEETFEKAAAREKEKRAEKSGRLLAFCDQCNLEFSTDAKFQRHHKTHHQTDKSIKNYLCDKCNYKTHSELLLKRHIRDAHVRNTRYPCEHCDKSFCIKTLLERHLEVHHREKIDMRYTCEHCSKQFYIKETFNRHHRRHYDPKSRLGPNGPSERFGRRKQPKKDFGYKMKVVKQVQCEHCLEIFNSTEGLHSHNKTAHPGLPAKAVGKDNHKCDVCLDYFISEYSMKRHQRKAHGIKMRKNTCEVCDIDYSFSHHCMQKRVKCPYCEKTYAKSKLNDHVRGVHLDMNDVPCNYCDKMFPSTSALSLHVTNHHEKTECRFCNKICSSKWEHKKHLALAHRQTKGAYFCPKCPKAVFFTWKMKSIHMKKKHDIELSPQKRSR